MPYSDPEQQKSCMDRYLKTPEGKAAKKRASTKYNRSKAHAASNWLWRQKNKHKVRAHGLLAYHLKKGNIVRPNHCERCDDECVPHGHHDDYSKPLDVKWLCVPCHKLEHAA